MLIAVIYLQQLSFFSFSFRHLDDRIVLVKSRPETVTSAGDTITIEGEGMPFHKRTHDKGDLYIKFSVIMPQTKDLGGAENKGKLRSLLPKVPELPSNIGTGEEYVAKLFDEVAQAAKQQRDRDYARQQYEEDDGDEGHGHTTQCRSQ